jgi:hypothetical protein
MRGGKVEVQREVTIRMMESIFIGRCEDTRNRHSAGGVAEVQDLIFGIKWLLFQIHPLHMQKPVPEPINGRDLDSSIGLCSWDGETRVTGWGQSSNFGQVY